MRARRRISFERFIVLVRPPDFPEEKNKIRG